MKKTLTAALTLSLLVGGGIAAARTPGQHAPRPDISRTQFLEQADQRFARMDANRDGTLSAADRAARGAARIAARFQRLDADHNGAVTLAEMKAAQEKRGGIRGEDGHRRGERHGRHGRGGGGRDFGAKGAADANKDGAISQAEFRATALARFDKAAADRNGVLTAAERQAAHAAMKGQRSR